MAQDYGVYKQGTDPIQWVKTENPLELTTNSDLALLNTEADAEDIAEELTSASTDDSVFKIGRPDDRHPH